MAIKICHKLILKLSLKSLTYLLPLVVKVNLKIAIYSFVCACVCVCAYVSCQLAACIMNTTDELAMLISEGDVAILQTTDLGLFWHDTCRYKV